jgi:NAD(P)-dependent dehydrogenase (short-subunit alcohol dehydrogenase family)
MTAAIREADMSHVRGVVAGGASGIGREVVSMLAGLGATIAILDRDGEGAHAAAKEEAAAGRSVSALELDVTDGGAVRDAFAEVAAGMKVNTLVNCVGSNRFKAVDEVTFDDWNEHIAVNLNGAWNLVAGFLPHLQEPEDSAIVLISSVAGISGIPKAAPYVSAKHGVIGLTRALALDLGPRGTTVNAVCPGVIGTPLLLRATTQTFRDQALERTPLRRLGRPEDVASAVAFLTSRAARWITGVILPVDGGLTCGIRSAHWE